MSRSEVVVRVRAVRPEEVPTEDDAHIALPADERVEEHLRVRLLVLSRVSLEWMPEDVHGVRVPELDAESEQSDRSREVEASQISPGNLKGQTARKSLWVYPLVPDTFLLANFLFSI